MNSKNLKLKNLGIDSQHEYVIFMRRDCHICQSEGFEVLTRVEVLHGTDKIIASINIVDSDILMPGEASLSQLAWQKLGVKAGDEIFIQHLDPLSSFRYIRGKIHGKRFDANSSSEIIHDIVDGKYSNVMLSSFVTVCGNEQLDEDETYYLAQAMVDVGERIKWNTAMVLDKHCVGGLPGNRTTLMIVPILSSLGITLPKTSSRAITSPSGSADTMEVFAPVSLEVSQIKKVVEKVGACMVWGGAVKLSPADDILIRVERVLNLDSEGQMIASILSKKLAAGSSHVLIEIPVGPTAKVRDLQSATRLKELLVKIGKRLGLQVKVLLTDGLQPVGRGIGPALEARDVWQVLNNDPNAPRDLREKSLTLAAELLMMTDSYTLAAAKNKVTEVLNNGSALKKFIAICEAQGGLKKIPEAKYKMDLLADNSGEIAMIDNRALAKLAKLSGAPYAKEAGVDFFSPLGKWVKAGDVLLTIHAASVGQLNYAHAFAQNAKQMMIIKS